MRCLQAIRGSCIHTLLRFAEIACARILDIADRIAACTVARAIGEETLSIIAWCLGMMRMMVDEGVVVVVGVASSYSAQSSSLD